MKYLFVCLSFVVLVFSEDVVHLQNYNTACARCLCHAATGCNLTFFCEKGHCGPFMIAKVYWIDAGNVTMPDDTPEREGAYADCSFSYPCAKKVVQNYLQKFGQDCNGDGVTNCDDYAMINVNGGNYCFTPLNGRTATPYAKEYLKRYKTCAPTAVD